MSRVRRWFLQHCPAVSWCGCAFSGPLAQKPRIVSIGTVSRTFRPRLSLLPNVKLIASAHT
eukprot:5996062-Amphidinium_carterae.1